MKTDVVIIGGGPAGASAAIFLEQVGVSSIIVEQETFPRYHIGESMTGAAGKVIRDLGLEPEMIARNYPVKNGVKVYGPKGTAVGGCRLPGAMTRGAFSTAPPGRCAAAILMPCCCNMPRQREPRCCPAKLPGRCSMKMVLYEG